MGLANAIEIIQDERVYVEKINGQILRDVEGTPAEYATEVTTRSRATGSICTNAGLTWSYESRRRLVCLLPCSTPFGHRP